MRTSNKIALFVMAILGVMLVLPAVSAAVTFVSPAAGTNQSSTMIVNVTLAAADCAACLNASIYYNASGGAAGTSGTLLAVITNDTASDLEFYTAAMDVSALSDATTYNFTAVLANATAVQVTSAGNVLTIDNTNPVSATPTVEKGKVSAGSTTDISWSSTDATSGLQSVVTTITSPNTNRCATQTFTTTSATTTLTGAETKCTGTYTVSTLSTDYAGNTHTASKTFKVTSAGTTRDGSNTLGGSGADGVGQGMNPVVIVIVIIVIVFIIRSRK